MPLPLFDHSLPAATLALAQQGGAQSRVDQQRQQEEIARQQSLLLANPPAAHPDVFITSLLPKQSTDGESAPAHCFFLVTTATIPQPWRPQLKPSTLTCSPRISRSIAPPPHTGIPTGEVVTITCTVINNGESPLNISGIMGSLNDPDNFKGAYLENFTGMPVGEVVEPGGELSLEYRVLPRVPGPMPAQLSALVFYEDADMYYASPCFNQTVVFVKGEWSCRLLPLGLATDYRASDPSVCV